LLVDLIDRRGPQKALFNTAQVVASLALGALLLRPFGVDGPITSSGSIAVTQAIGVMIAGAVVFVTNGMLTCIVLSLYHRTSLRSMLGRDFVLSVSADGALLALSPIFVIVISSSLLLVPLLGITAFLVYRSTQQALQRAHEASHDSLTKLLNRRAFHNHVEAFLASQGDASARGAIVLLDLDGFKDVNDRLGHDIGDRLLCGVATQITSAAPRGSVVARLGGDEFALLVPDAGDDDEAAAMAEHLRRRITRPIDIDGFPLQVGASVGVAFAPLHGRTAGDLLSAADIAMYRSKHYRSGVELFRSTGSGRELGRVSLLSDLSSAIEAQQLSVQYQPQISFAADRPICVEALIRWNHPVLGQVAPHDFIGLAEHTELIGPLTQFVLRQATDDALALDDEAIRVAINVSARNLQDRRFPASVLARLSAVSLPTARLELEINERAIATEPERSRHAIGVLRDAGVTVTIDNFGAGAASFAMLQDLHVDRLKIDSRFIRGIATSPRQQHIVRGIVALADGFGIETVAEGVEMDADWRMLSTLGCDFAQGYLVGRPVAAGQLSSSLRMDRADS
jgi:diguanylate cyclase (GGDEF)-like protein